MRASSPSLLAATGRGKQVYRFSERVRFGDLPPAERKAINKVVLRQGGLDGVLFFSPRTARTFASLVKSGGLEATCAGLAAFCLSPAVADALAGLAFRHVGVAQRPETDALLALLSCETPTP